MCLCLSSIVVVDQQHSACVALLRPCLTRQRTGKRVCESGHSCQCVKLVESWCLIQFKRQLISGLASANASLGDKPRARPPRRVGHSTASSPATSYLMDQATTPADEAHHALSTPFFTCAGALSESRLLLPAGAAGYARGQEGILISGVVAQLSRNRPRGPGV